MTFNDKSFATYLGGQNACQKISVCHRFLETWLKPYFWYKRSCFPRLSVSSFLSLAIWDVFFPLFPLFFLPFLLLDVWRSNCLWCSFRPASLPSFPPWGSYPISRLTLFSLLFSCALETQFLPSIYCLWKVPFHPFQTTEKNNKQWKPSIFRWWVIFASKMSVLFLWGFFWKRAAFCSVSWFSFKIVWNTNTFSECSSPVRSIHKWEC